MPNRIGSLQRVKDHRTRSNVFRRVNSEGMNIDINISKNLAVAHVYFFMACCWPSCTGSEYRKPSHDAATRILETVKVADYELLR